MNAFGKGRSLFVSALTLAVSCSSVTLVGAQEQRSGYPAGGDGRSRSLAENQAAQRAAAAESVLAAKEQARGESFDPSMRAGLKGRMEALSMEQLAGLAEQGADADLPQALGSVTGDLVYTPVTPCRVFDSRVSAGGPGPIAAGSQRNVFVAGTANFPAQGGTVGGCAVPIGATSAIINFVTVLPAGPGNIRAWAVANPQPVAPLAAIMNYGMVAGLPAIANGVAVPLCNPAATSCAAGDLRLQADTSATDILGDVVGYFAAGTIGQVLVQGQQAAPFTPPTGSGSPLGSPAAYGAVPGMSANVTLPASSFVFVTATGAVSNAAPGTSRMDIAVFVDGAIAMAGANPATTSLTVPSGGTTPFAFSLGQALSAGAHTITVRAQNYGGFPAAVVGRDAPAHLTAIVVKQ